MWVGHKSSRRSLENGKFKLWFRQASCLSVTFNCEKQANWKPFVELKRCWADYAFLTYKKKKKKGRKG